MKEILRFFVTTLWQHWSLTVSTVKRRPRWSVKRRPRRGGVSNVGRGGVCASGSGGITFLDVLDAVLELWPASYAIFELGPANCEAAHFAYESKSAANAAGSSLISHAADTATGSPYFVCNRESKSASHFTRQVTKVQDIELHWIG